MKNTLLLCCAVLISTLSLAQQHLSLSGKIVDEQQLPIPGANVLLLRDSLLHKSAITDIDGSYIFELLPEGRYQLQATALSYQAYQLPPFELHSSESMPDIILKEQKGQLQEVTITAQRPFIEVK